MTTLRLILGDQLNHNHSWFQNTQKGVHYLMMEMRQETDYVTHHIQKVCSFFLAMRRFAGFLENQGFQVHYLKLDDTGNAQALSVPQQYVGIHSEPVHTWQVSMEHPFPP